MPRHRSKKRRRPRVLDHSCPTCGGGRDADDLLCRPCWRRTDPRVRRAAQRGGYVERDRLPDDTRLWSPDPVPRRQETP